jgi:hypothetical protein
MSGDPSTEPETEPNGEDPDKQPDQKPEPGDWKEQARRWEKEAKAARAEAEKLRKATQTETEKAIEAAREEGRTAARTELSDRLLSAEIRSTATGKLADPADAEPLLRANGLAEGLLDRDGEPDPKAVAAAIDRLVKMKPHLAADERPKPLPGGSKKPPASTSVNDSIRRAAGRA